MIAYSVVGRPLNSAGASLALGGAPGSVSPDGTLRYSFTAGTYTPGAVYSFTVAAVTALGVGEEAGPLLAVTPACDAASMSGTVGVMPGGTAYPTYSVASAGSTGGGTASTGTTAGTAARVASVGAGLAPPTAAQSAADAEWAWVMEEAVAALAAMQ